MTRRTSINTYRQIEAEGLLSKRRWQVYDHLYKSGPLSQMEVTKTLCKFNEDITEHSFTPRFAELEKLGVIQSVGEKVCTVTGRQVISWDVTDSLPRKITQEREATRTDLINSLCSQLEPICDFVQKQAKTEKWITWTKASREILKKSAKYRKGLNKTK